MKPIISVTQTTKPVLDSMERPIAAPVGGAAERSENPTPNANHAEPREAGAANDECWVAEGRSPDLEGVREAQHER